MYKKLIYQSEIYNKGRGKIFILFSAEKMYFKETHEKIQILNIHKSFAENF